MEAGEFSNVPSKPHTGILGILIKHREQLEPGNKIQGNLATQQLALARALAEILDGIKPSESTVNLTLDMAEVAEMVKPLTEKVAEVIGKIETLGAELNQAKEEYNRTRSSMIDRILLLEARIETMESRLFALESPNRDVIERAIDIGPQVTNAEFAQGGIVLNPPSIVAGTDVHETIVPVDNAKVSFPPIVPSGRVGGRRRIE